MCRLLCWDGPRAYLVCKQQANGFQTLFATVNVVPQKQIVGLGWEPSVLKQPEQVRVLSVNITCADQKALAADVLITRVIYGTPLGSYRKS